MSTKVPLQVNQVEKNVLRTCHNVVIGDLEDVWWHCDITLALTDVMLYKIDVRVPGDTTQVTSGTIVTIREHKILSLHISNDNGIQQAGVS